MPFEWGYDKHNGPQTWSKYYPEAAGKQQSPVNIQQAKIEIWNTNKKLSWKYIANCTELMENPGYCWKVKVSGKGLELTGGPLEGKYVLEQFHCHWGATDTEGSEHTVDGKKYAGELHLVHWNGAKYKTFEDATKHPDGLCVLGVFLKPGKLHRELDKIVAQLPKIQYKHQSTKVPETIDPSLLLPESNCYYTYQGSLTTPPCSECVIWIVFKEPIEVAHEQLAAFRNLKSYTQKQTPPKKESKGFVKNNFRPTLPLGERIVREQCD